MKRDIKQYENDPRVCHTWPPNFTEVYVLHGEGKTKIGITHDTTERFRKLKERTPFEFEPVGYWFCNTYDLTFKVEAVLHRHFEEYSSNLKGFDGAKEWFNMAPFEACDLLTSFLGAPVK